MQLPGITDISEYSGALLAGAANAPVDLFRNPGLLSTQVAGYLAGTPKEEIATRIDQINDFYDGLYGRIPGAESYAGYGRYLRDKYPIVSSLGEVGASALFGASGSILGGINLAKTPWGNFTRNIPAMGRAGLNDGLFSAIREFLYEPMINNPRAPGATQATQVDPLAYTGSAPQAQPHRYRDPLYMPDQQYRSGPVFTPPALPQIVPPTVPFQRYADPSFVRTPIRTGLVGPQVPKDILGRMGDSFLAL